ncbi:MAG: gliding motility-associated C-terminal domain-containing protein [Flavobacteriales bacterium]|jgi:gliding motility-associated-like protein|nr:gliding motility-associated C-terminal domain-containing protein [Flavobacteriales bacterium]
MINQIHSQLIPDSLLPQVHKRDLNNTPIYQKGNVVTCGTAPNQFSIQIVPDSNYNGYELQCADGCTGFYTVNVTGGVGPFTFQWLGSGNPATQTAQSWTNVCDQSSIQVLVTDVGQGVTCAASHVLNVPDRLRTINFTLTPPSCFNTCDGTATHSPVFGVPPYNFNWTNGETTQNASSLCIGSSTLTITDLNGCQFDTTVNIVTPPPIFANINITEVTCNNACDGILTSTPTGGTGAPYNFTWTEVGPGTNVGNTNTASNLCENNTYNLHLTDNTGCAIDTAVTLADKQPMTISVASSTDAQCSNTCDGQVSLNVTGGTPPYVNVSWYQGTLGSGILQPFSGQSVSSLCPFTNYYAVVTDSDGCMDSLQITPLNAPPTITITETHTDNNCFGDNSGTITINVSGGTSSGTYTYLWTTSDGSGLSPASQNQTGLSGGTYQVLVTDDIGCQDSLSITIAEPTQINANGIATDVTCFNLTDGTIDLTTTGGAGGYTWNWTSTDGSFINPGTEDLSGLDSASYTVRITDADGCFIDTTLTISKPDEIFINPTVSPILCNGDDNAQINLAPTNGTGTYTYDWDIDGTGDFDDNQNQTGLAPNTYNLSVRDANGCQKDTVFTITEPDPISVTHTAVQSHCGQADGSITATAAGGTPTYNYSWTDAGGSNVGNTATASNLSAGCYDVTVTDANTCTFTQQICITDLAPPTATLTPTDASCNGVCDGAITIVITDGTAPYTTTWTSTDPGFVDPNTDDISNLCAADYTLQITDATNCIFTQTVTINEPTQINANGITTPVTCFNLNDGTIDLTTTGGAGGYTWNWTSTDGSFVNPGTEDLSGLDSASYTVRITDADGCFIDTTLSITKPDEIFINGVVTPITCNNANDGQITIAPVNGTGTYTYDWDIDGTGDFDDNQNQTNLTPNTYNLSVRDGNGCQKDTAFTLTEPSPITISTTDTQPNCGQSDGSITATATGGTPNYTYSWTDINGTVISNSATANNLAAGCYDVLVTDASLCTETIQVCITDLAAPTVTFNSNDASCNAICDGSISVNISGGTAPYNTTWTSTDPGFTDPNTDNIFLLCAADYTLALTDANNCTFNQTVTINEPLPITITDIITPVSCNNGNDGAIDITATGGTVAGSYTYSWSGSNAYSNNTEDISGLPTGSYTVIVTDDNNCNNTASFNITEPTPIVISTTTTNSQCTGSTGSITASVSGGTATYNYSWTDALGASIGGNSPSITNQPSGIYTLTVTDLNGCTETITATISDDVAPTLTIDNFNDVSCNGANDGLINITATGGTGTLTYSWTSTPTGYTSNAEDINLLAGTITYNITVTDANGCSANQSQLINEPQPISLNANTTDPLCNGGNDGSIDLSVNGGTAPFTFDWDNDGTGDFDDTEDIGGLVAGNYIISVLDNNNCPQTQTISLNEPSAINLVTSSVNSNCTQSDGSATVTASNGTPIPPNSYTYQWTPSGQTVPVLSIASTLSNQPAGCYDVTVNDANNCSTTTTVCITDNNAPDLTINATDVTCFGNTDGTINLSITNGQTPYNPIVWTGNTAIPNGSLNATNLQSGIYAVQVTDGAGCIATISDTINDPLQILIAGTTNNPNCNNGNDGTIDVSITNGTTPFTYSWTGPAGFIDPGTEDLNALTAGQYCITVTDANNCSNTQCFNLSNPTALSITTTSTPTDCNTNTGQLTAAVSGGTPTYNYNWANSLGTSVGTNANINGLGADTYTLTVTDNNGCTSTASETITLANGPTTTLVNANDVLCRGEATGSIVISVSGGTLPYSFDWDNLVGTNDPQNQNNLPAGNYTVTTTDAAGCSDNLLVTINEPLLALTANGVSTNAACNGLNTGAIDLTVTGGTPNYSFLWSNSGNTEDINGLSAGTYSVIVTDNNGCQAFDTTVITAPTALNLVMNSNEATCGLSNGSIAVNVTGGNPTYNYSWTDVTNSQPGTTIGGNTNSVNTLPAGSYQVVVTDNNGCSDSSIVAISNTNGPTVTALVTDVLCYGGASGAIDITVSGTPNFTFNWTGPLPFTGAITEDIATVEAGTYTVAVTDGNNCITNQVITINGPTAPIQDNAVVNSLTCYNDSTGGIDLSPSGGTSPYNFTWTGPNSFTSNAEDINNLLSGTYQLQIIDNNGCQYNNNLAVTQPDSIQITATPTLPTCGVNDGQITVSVTGGTITTDYNYAWIDLTSGTAIGSTNSINSLGAGNYQVTVTDDNGCSNSLIISLSDDNAPPLTINSTDVDCFSNATGAIDLTVGGTNTYTYDWDIDGTGDNDDNEDLNALIAGVYNVIVTDQTTGCIATTSATITEPAPLSLTANTLDLTCFNDNSGSIDVTVTGGTSPYSFDWDNLTIPNEPEDQNGLAAGTYSLTVTDNNGCIIADVYNLTQPLAIETPAILTHNNCFGQAQGAIDISPNNGTTPYTYNWTSLPPFAGSVNEDLTNLTAGTYNLTITDFNGCSKDTAILIIAPTALSLDLTINDANCNTADGSATVNVSGGTLTSPDYSYDWQFGGGTISTTNSINAVGAGTYLLSVTDDNGCQRDSLISINNINAPIIVVDSIHTPNCFGDQNGGIYVSISGGTAPYSQLWNPNAISNTEDLTNVVAGNYTLTVTDNVGCISTLDTSIVEPSPILTTTTVIDATCDSCNGSAILATTGGIGTINYLWSDNSTNNSIQNLCAGIYPVLVSDDNGCQTTSNVTINNTGGPTGENVIVNNVSCNGGNDGSITITALGGVAPYTYFWPHNNSTNNTQTNLTAGNYSVQMQDINGCIRNATITITEPNAIHATSFITPATCANSDGAITLNINGGVAPYGINWAGGIGTTANVSNLNSGVYSVTITDANACSASFNFNLPDIAAPEVSLAGTDLSCFGDSSGVIASTVSGNTGTITYQWFQSNTLLAGETNATINNMPAGAYTLVVLDNTTGCSNQAALTITEPTPITLGLPTIMAASCNSVCDGSALVNPLGGTLGYSYQWNNGETTQAADSLCPGINSVLITDANNCSIEQTVQTIAINNLMATTTNTDANCGQCDGMTTVTPTGGSGSYSILWADGSTGLTHNNLCAGIHPFEVIDNNGCAIQLQTIISNIGGPDGETINKTDVSCNGGNDGAIIINPTGGTLPYDYLWIPTGQTSNSINNLEAGTYYLEVTDSNRCTRVVPVEITEPELPIINAVVTNSNCGNSDGSIALNINGINGPYTLSWNGPNGFVSSLQTLSNLETGIYELTITDNNGCISVHTYTVNATTAPIVSISGTNVSCFGLCDGSAQVTASPTTGNYTYNWINTTITTPTINNLCAGTHLVEVTDMNTGCLTTQSIVIEEADSISIEVPHVQNPTCFETCDGVSTIVVTGGALNYTYNWLTGSNTETQNNLCVGDSKVIVTDANGCTDSITITVIEPTEIIINIDSTINSECVYSTEGAIYTTVTGGTPGYSYAWETMPSTSFSANTEDITGLLPTHYILTVTDNNNCIKMDTIGIDTNHIVLANAGLDTAICIGECAAFIGQGQGPSGIVFEWFDEFGNSLSNTDSVYVCPDSVKNCNFILEVSDAFCSHRDSVNLIVWGLPEVDAGEDQTNIFGSEITLGGSPTAPAGQDYTWGPTDNIINGSENQPNPLIELNEEQDFVVVVVDTNGCVNSDTVHVRPIPEISFPNGFTPNDDGTNDYWQIDFIKEFPQSVVEVYNRWGQLLFRSIGYNEPWDGIYKGKRLPVGTYYYIIELNDPNFPDAFTGPITIMR